MADIIIGSVMRAGAFSPNHIGNDAAIFNIVASELRKRGMQVNVYSEQQLQAGEVTEDIIVNMCREHQSMRILQQYEDQGRLVINSGYGIENCTRERMTRILIQNGIPYPESVMVDTDKRLIELLKERNFGACWVKRGESHSMHKEDISYVRHPEEAQDVVREYFMRGIKRAVINRHLDGDLIKFYGVAGSPFFFYFYPFEGHVSSDNVSINGKPHKYGFDLDNFKQVCAKAAEAMDIVIYGGDAIIDEEGNFAIIDFNDWPSFAPCRDEAAPYIAKAILGKIKKHNSEKLKEGSRSHH